MLGYCDAGYHEDIRQDKQKRMAVPRCPVIHRILLITVRTIIQMY